jgi:hypothetical protein
MGLRNLTDGKTTYGLNGEAQQRLAAIRTDLDVFHDAEALSLMYSAYRLTSMAMADEEALPQLSAAPAKQEAWAFSVTEKALTGASPPDLLMLLESSEKRFFKAWQIIPSLRVLGVVLCLSFGGFGLYWLYRLWAMDASVRVDSILNSIAMAVIVFLIGWAFEVRIPNRRREIANVALALTGFALAKFHRAWIDPAYLKAGKWRAEWK